MKEFLNKEVLLYPGDSHQKTAIVKEVNNNGVIFQITGYNGTNKSYAKGELHFIAYSSNLHFRLLKPKESIFNN